MPIGARGGSRGFPLTCGVYPHAIAGFPSVSSQILGSGLYRRKRRGLDSGRGDVDPEDVGKAADIDPAKSCITLQMRGRTWNTGTADKM